MKKLILTLVIFFFPLMAGAESITSFQSDITLTSDGTFEVAETISYDFGSDDRHGIFRYVPTKHTEDSTKWFQDRYIDIDILSVSMDGGEVPFEISENLGELEVKVGDPDETITGEHTYFINYRVSGALYYYDSSAVDLYWNVTGNGWTVPIEKVEARIHDPEDVALDESSCYRGASGETGECMIDKGEAIVMSASDLSVGEGMTVAQSLDPARVEVLILERSSFWPLWLGFALLWIIWLIWYLFHYAREHRTGSSIIAQYEPYMGLKPMYTGVLFDGRVDPQDITAGLVYLAEQGFFKIRHIGRKMFFFIETDDYEIVLLRPYGELETEFQKTLFKLMFSESASIGDKVVLSELNKNLTKKVENQTLLNELRQAAEADLLKDGFFGHEWRRPGKIVGILAILLVLGLSLTALLGADLVIPLVASAFLLVATSIGVLLVHRRRTRKGYEALDHLNGFKEFLSVTDKERFKFHNAPQKSPEQFMAYLPYAIAFGVEKEWAAAFKNISMPEPDWYDGRGTTFNAVYLSQSLGTFGTSMASASGASASSGGGSSGGGAGGGGGGSW